MFTENVQKAYLNLMTVNIRFKSCSGEIYGDKTSVDLEKSFMKCFVVYFICPDKLRCMPHIFQQNKIQSLFFSQVFKMSM